MSREPCSIADCGAIARTRGMCFKHYSRWYRHGNPMSVFVAIDQETLHRLFWERVQVNQRSVCWKWLGTRQGVRGFLGRRSAHRLSYEINVGPIPPGLEIDHLCGNPWCVNPGHLEAVSSSENKARRIAYLPEVCVNGHPREHGQRCARCDHAKHVRLGRERAALVRAAAESVGMGWRDYVRHYGQSKSRALEILGGAA